MAGPAFPGAEDVAKLELEYRLGRRIRGGDYATLLNQQSWQNVYLSTFDLMWFSEHGIRWSDYPQHNGITRLLKPHIEKMREVGIELTSTTDGIIFRRIATI